ncbi:MAG: hypothetical protein ACLP7Q_07530 [Isosphaeraceae bacterium]
MATTKSSGESKAKAVPKKAAPRASAAKEAAPKKTEAAPKKRAANATATNATSTNAKATAAKATATTATAKKTAPKKALGPKLTPPQLSLLEVISKVTAPQGYVAEKKPEQKTVDTLLKHKLVKKGKKDEKTKSYYVLISQFGKKFLGTIQASASKA